MLTYDSDTTVLKHADPPSVPLSFSVAHDPLPTSSSNVLANDYSLTNRGPANLIRNAPALHGTANTFNDTPTFLLFHLTVW